PEVVVAGIRLARLEDQLFETPLPRGPPNHLEGDMRKGALACDFLEIHSEPKKQHLLETRRVVSAQKGLLPFFVVVRPQSRLDLNRLLRAGTKSSREHTHTAFPTPIS